MEPSIIFYDGTLYSLHCSMKSEHYDRAKPYIPGKTIHCDVKYYPDKRVKYLLVAMSRVLLSPSAGGVATGASVRTVAGLREALRCVAFVVAVNRIHRQLPIVFSSYLDILYC